MDWFLFLAMRGEACSAYAWSTLSPSFVKVMENLAERMGGRGAEWEWHGMLLLRITSRVFRLWEPWEMEELKNDWFSCWPISGWLAHGDEEAS